MRAVSDIQLLTFGCVITFIAAAGAYVALRAGFLRDFPEEAIEERTQEGSPAPVLEKAKNVA